MTNTKESMNLVFVNQNKEDSMYSLITREILETQQQDNDLNQQADKEGVSTQLVEKNKVLWKDAKWLFPKAYNTVC